MKKILLIITLCFMFVLPFGSSITWDPVGYYALDQTSGAVVDSSDHGFNGTNVGSTRGVTGKINNSFDFDGINDNVNLTREMITATQESTVNLWALSDLASQTKFLVSQSADAAGRQRIGLRQVGTSWGVATSESDLDQIFAASTTSVSTTDWQMVTLRRNATHIAVFVNGTVEDVTAWDGTDIANNNIMLIGSRGAPSSLLTFDGSIDEVGIWNRSLTDLEIQELYNNGSGLAFGKQPTITLNSPDDGFEGVRNSNILFNATAELTGKTLVNMSLVINGTLNETKSVSGSTDTETFTKAFSTLGLYNWSIIICDNTTLCTESEVRTFTISDLVINSQTFNSQALEGSTQSFQISIDAYTTVAAGTLWYDGVAYSGSINQVDSDTYNITRTLTLPTITSDVNKSFHWSITLADASQTNSSSNNQTIINMEIDNCTTYTNQILNLTQLDEEMQTSIVNGTVEIAINLLDLERTQTVLSLSGEFENENPLGICLSQNLTNEQYSLDAIIKYTANNYAIEYYNIVDSELTNSSGVLNITLFNLNASDSTEFQLTFTGDDFLPVEGALVFVERQYIAENIFKTVELPKTDSNGQTILHLVRNDIIYNIRIVKDNEILGNFQNIVAFCEDFTIGNCALSLNSLSNVSSIANYDDTIGVTYVLPPTFNSTSNVVSFSFTSTDGTPKTVRMFVERRDVFGNISICSSVVVSSSGTTSCNIGTGIEDTTLFVRVLIDDEELLTTYIITDESNYGTIGFVVWFIMSIVLLLMFSESKEGVLFSVVIGYIGAVSMSIANGTIIGLGSAGIWIIAITLLGTWQLNKTRRQ